MAVVDPITMLGSTRYPVVDRKRPTAHSPHSERARPTVTLTKHLTPAWPVLLIVHPCLRYGNYLA